MSCYVLRVPATLAKKIGKNHGLWDSICWQAAEAHDIREYERQLASMSEADRAQAIARREAKMSGELGRMLRASMARNESKHARAKGLVTEPAHCLDKAGSVIENALMSAGYKQGLHEGSEAGKDHGDSRPLLRSPAQTAAFATFLNQHSSADLMSRMDPVDAAKVVFSPDGDGARLFAEVLDEYYPPLRAYVSQAAGDGDALLGWTV
jgi:hypothetical protein